MTIAQQTTNNNWAINLPINAINQRINVINQPIDAFVINYPFDALNEPIADISYPKCVNECETKSHALTWAMRRHPQ